MERQLYELEIEVRARPGARFPSGIEGAFVRFYVAAEDFMEAIEKMRAAVDIDRYALIEILLCRRIDPDEWEEEREDLFEEDGESYPDADDLFSLLDNDGWLYGPFYGYTDEDTGFGDAGLDDLDDLDDLEELDGSG